MQKSTKITLLLGCGGAGFIVVMAAAAIVWLVWGAAQSVNINMSSGYVVQDGKVKYYAGLSGFGPPQSWEIKEADAGTFQVLDTYYARDKNYAYVMGRRIEQSSGESFEVIQLPYSRDQNHIFYETRVMSDAPQNYRFLAQNAERGTFITDGEKVYRDEKALYPGTLDPASFELIGDSDYFKDKRHVYNFDKILDGADPATFAQDSHYLNYTSDKNSVYYKNEKIRDCDSKTHKALGYNLVADARSVFYGTQKISSDPNHFEALKAEYSRDGANVYWKEKKIGTDTRQFTTFPTSGMIAFGKDGSNVYWCDKILPGADAASFEGLSAYYGKDKNHVWYGTYEEQMPTIIQAADPATFELIGNEYDAKDKTNHYHFGDIARQ